jgi:hypothetical protein
MIHILTSYVDLIRHNSSQPGMGSTAFKGDVTLEKYLTTQLMTARKTRDTFRTNVLRVSGRMMLSRLLTDAILPKTRQ